MMEIYEAGKLPQRSDSPASLRAKDGRHEWNGIYTTREKKSKTKQTSSGILFIHSRFREPLVVNTVA